MKNKGMLYAAAIVALDLLAAVILLKPEPKPVDTTQEQYNTAISMAQSFEEKNLCEKAINYYSTANSLISSKEVRMKIAELYGKGFENGEFKSDEYKYSVLEDIVADYPMEGEAYDILIKQYFKDKEYVKCAAVIKNARNNSVSTPTVDEYYETIRHMYSLGETAFDTMENAGTYYVGTKMVTVITEKKNEKGEVIYKEDEEGNKIAETEEREMTSYAFFKSDGSSDESFEAVNMSVLGEVTDSNGNAHKAYFWKNYGNDVDGGDSSEIYSSVIVDGVRQSYVGENNEYEAASPFGNGFITLRNINNGKYVLANAQGQILSDDFDYIGCFSNSVVYTEKGDSKRILNTGAQSIFEKEIDDVILGYGGRCSTSNRMFVKFKGSKSYTMINTEDLSEVGFECEDATLFLTSAAAFKKDGKWGYVLNTGEVVIEPQYEDARSFSHGYGAVKKDGKWGFINTSREMIVEPVFDDVLTFMTDGSVFVYTEEKGWERLTLYYR